MKPTDTRHLVRSGLMFTALGLSGTSFATPHSSSADSARQLVSSARASGIRFFETAPEYGRGFGEYRLGRALQEFDRASYVLSTVVGQILASKPVAAETTYTGPSLEVQYDYTYDGVMRGVEHSMRRLGTDRFDLLLIRGCDRATQGVDQPEVFRQALGSAYPALESLRSQGAVTAIGFESREADVGYSALKNTDADCLVLAGGFTLEEPTALTGILLPACEETGAGLILRDTGNSLEGPGPAGNIKSRRIPSTADERKRRARFAQICAAYGVPPRAAALRFLLSHPAVVSVCVEATIPQQLRTAHSMLERDIPPDFWAALCTADVVQNTCSSRRCS